VIHKVWWNAPLLIPTGLLSVIFNANSRQDRRVPALRVLNLPLAVEAFFSPLSLMICKQRPENVAPGEEWQIRIKT
jgi:hypothetical protein